LQKALLLTFAQSQQVFLAQVQAQLPEGHGPFGAHVDGIERGLPMVVDEDLHARLPRQGQAGGEVFSQAVLSLVAQLHAAHAGGQSLFQLACAWHDAIQAVVRGCERLKQRNLRLMDQSPRQGLAQAQLGQGCTAMGRACGKATAGHHGPSALARRVALHQGMVREHLAQHAGIGLHMTQCQCGGNATGQCAACAVVMWGCHPRCREPALCMRRLQPVDAVLRVMAGGEHVGCVSIDIAARDEHGASAQGLQGSGDFGDAEPARVGVAQQGQCLSSVGRDQRGTGH
jgi:hypothetical protein